MLDLSGKVEIPSRLHKPIPHRAGGSKMTLNCETDKIWGFRAHVAARLVRDYQANTNGPERSVLSDLVGRICRQTPLRRFYVSEAAQTRATEMGLRELWRYGWGRQRTQMKDPTRAIFMWEHLWTVREQREALLRLVEPTPERALMILRRSAGAWILKTEDKALNDAGFKEVRRFPFKAYKSVGIKLVQAPEVPW